MRDRLSLRGLPLAEQKPSGNPDLCRARWRQHRVPLQPAAAANVSELGLGYHTIAMVSHGIYRRRKVS